MAPSSTLDAAYAVERVGVSIKAIEKELDGLRQRPQPSKPTTETEQTPEQMLLLPRDGDFIARSVGIPELGPEVERAVKQVEKSIEARKQLNEKNAGHEQAGGKK